MLMLLVGCVGFILGVMFSLLVVPIIIFVYEHLKESDYSIDRKIPVSTYEDIKSSFHNN